MTRKHFEIIAHQINRQLNASQMKPINPQAHLTELAENLAKAFVRVNPHFNTERFIDSATK